MDKTYYIRQAKMNDLNNLYEISKDVACNLGGIILTESFRAIIKSKKIILVAADDNDVPVGFIVGKFVTKGCFYNQDLGVLHEHRLKGVGGGLIICLLRLLKSMDVHKWFGMFPSYNQEVRELYKVLKFPIEGVLRKHTRAKTDMTLVAFYLDEMQIPNYWYGSNPEASVMDDKQALADKYDIPKNMIDGTFLGDGIKRQEEQQTKSIFEW